MTDPKGTRLRWCETRGRRERVGPRCRWQERKRREREGEGEKREGVEEKNKTQKPVGIHGKGKT